MDAFRREGNGTGLARKWTPGLGGEQAADSRPGVFLMSILEKQSTEGDGGAEAAEAGGW